MSATYNTFGESETYKMQVERIHDFDDVLNMVGGYGKYQKRLLYAVFGPILFFLSLNTNTSVFYLAVPNHWCHVPPAEASASFHRVLSWKNFTIPSEIGPNKRMRFSQCMMYVSEQNHTQIQCNHGWDYDTTMYTATIPSTYDWVCDKSNYATGLLMASPIGTLFGTVVFGLGGDRFGRKRTLFVCLILFGLFRTLGFILAKYILALFSFSFLAGMVLDPAISLLFLIAAEVTGKDHRSWMYGARYIISTCGDALLPFIAWITGGDWVILIVIITPPLFALLLLYEFVPESPRWLLAEGRITEAGEVVQKIAKINGNFKNFEPGFLRTALQNIASHDGRYNGNWKGRLWQLFSHKDLAINTALVSCSRAINGVVAFGISVNVVTLSGNPFFNYFITSVNTLPTGWVGNWLVGKTGRRWTNTFAVFLAGMGFLVVILATMENIQWLIISTLVFTTFLMSIGSMISPLQAVELFPTELRSTGAGVSSFFGGVGTALAPSIVALGQMNVVFPYITLFCICVIGSIAISFLPETLNKDLPDTLEEASDLRRSAKYWSFLSNPTTTEEKVTVSTFVDANSD